MESTPTCRGPAAVEIDLNEDDIGLAAAINQAGQAVVITDARGDI